MSQPERTMMFVYNAGLQAKLVGMGAFKGKEWQLGAGTFTIGREPGNDLVLDKEAGVSKTHCKITYENSQFVVADAESRNGTLVNGVAVKRALLRDKDELRICGASFRFESPAHPAEANRAAPVPATPPPPRTASSVTATATTTPQMAAQEEEEPAGAVWPYFLAGMLVFFGLAAGTAWYLGYFPKSGPQVATAPPKEVPPPDQPIKPDEPVAVKPGEKTPEPDVDAPKPATKPDVKPDEKPEPAPTQMAGGGKDPVVAKPDEKPETAPVPAKDPPKPVENEYSGTLKLVSSGGGGGGGSTTVVKHAMNARVASVSVKVGQRVAKGDTLLSYDDAGLRGSLATAREQFRSLREIAEAQDTDRARKALAEARSDLNRLESQLAALKLTAPMDGVVSNLDAASGKRAGKGTDAVSITAGGKGGGGAVNKATVAGIVANNAKIKPKEGSKALVMVAGEEYPATVTDAFGVPAGIKTTLELGSVPPGASDGASVKFKLVP